MSEYQYIAFQAIDRPLTDAELKYAEKQSTRAHITRWSFTNEYNYGDFGGNPKKLLQGGYDVHLHYANFGIRIIMMRLPTGLPFPKSVWSQYINGQNISWQKDSKGPGGILTVSPYNEPDAYEEIWEPEQYLDDVVQVRNELVDGDLRALYTLWICGAKDDDLDPADVLEPPIPAGIGQASKNCHDLLQFYDIDPLILVAAGENSLSAPESSDVENFISDWVQNLSQKQLHKLLIQLLGEDSNKAKTETIAKIREASPQTSWPVSPSDRTLEQLWIRTEQLREEENARQQAKDRAAAKREATRKERQRQDRMKQMVKDPKKWLNEADKLVEQRGTVNYQAAAEMLADLGEAIGSVQGAKLVRKHAAHLAQSYPTLNHLKSSLRKRGLLK